MIRDDTFLWVIILSIWAKYWSVRGYKRKRQEIIGIWPLKLPLRGAFNVEMEFVAYIHDIHFHQFFNFKGPYIESYQQQIKSKLSNIS